MATEFKMPLFKLKVNLQTLYKRKCYLCYLYREKVTIITSWENAFP